MRTLDDVFPKGRETRDTEFKGLDAKGDPDDRDAHHDSPQRIADKRPQASEDKPDDIPKQRHDDLFSRAKLTPEPELLLHYGEIHSLST